MELAEVPALTKLNHFFFPPPCLQCSCTYAITKNEREVRGGRVGSWPEYEGVGTNLDRASCLGR